MLLSEFIDRTGYQPTAEEYAEIEQAYYVFDGDKDAFCKAWSKANPHKAGTLWAAIKEQQRLGKVFDKVAEVIYSFPEVKSLYLMSGAYDLHVVLEGKTMREVASFVSEKLATIDAVLSTSTHFVLKKYKDKGVIYGAEETDERGSCAI